MADTLVWLFENEALKKENEKLKHTVDRLRDVILKLEKQMDELRGSK